MKLINSSTNYTGIYRSLLIDYNGELRIYTPGINSNIIDLNNLDKYKYSLPIPIWNVPNLEAQTHEVPTHPCWVTFENGDSRKPIIMGWFGKGIKYNAANVSKSNDKPEIETPETKPKTDKSYPTSGVFVDNYNKDWSDGYVILEYFLNKGYTLAGSCAILGNLWIEGYSWNGRQYRFDPQSDNGLGYYGIAQWGGSRLDELKKLNNYDTLDVQLDYIHTEMTTISTYSKTYALLTNSDYDKADQVEYLTKYVCRYYEVAISSTQGKYNADVYFDDYWLQGGSERIAAAKTFYEKLTA